MIAINSYCTRMRQNIQNFLLIINGKNPYSAWPIVNIVSYSRTALLYLIGLVLVYSGKKRTFFKAIICNHIIKGRENTYFFNVEIKLHIGLAYSVESLGQLYAVAVICNNIVCHNKRAVGSLAYVDLKHLHIMRNRRFE